MYFVQYVKLILKYLLWKDKFITALFCIAKCRRVFGRVIISHSVAFHCTVSTSYTHRDKLLV